MKPVADFLPFVLPYVPGCSNPMAEQAIVSSCIEFCENSQLVQNVHSVDVVAGVTDYDVELLPQASLVKVLAVFYMGNKLRARSRENVVSGFAFRDEPIAGESLTAGTPTEWFMRQAETNLISVYPPPATSVAGAMTVVSTQQPAYGATRVPDILFDNYADAIGAGAVARLLLVPGQPFSAPAQAGVYRAQFLDAMGNASAIGRRGRVPAASRVQRRFFAR